VHRLHQQRITKKAENLLQVVKDNSFYKENAFTKPTNENDSRFRLWSFLEQNGEFASLSSDLDEIIAIVCDYVIEETIKKQNKTK